MKLKSMALVGLGMAMVLTYQKLEEPISEKMEDLKEITLDKMKKVKEDMM